jgi:hypothetical protein
MAGLPLNLQTSGVTMKKLPTVRPPNTRDLLDYPDRPLVGTRDLPVGCMMVWMDRVDDTDTLYLGWGKLEGYFSVDWVPTGKTPMELPEFVFLDQGDTPIQDTKWVRLTTGEAQLVLWMSEVFNSEENTKLPG